MRKRSANTDLGIVAVYWFARLTDALESGDTLMADAARDRLLGLGFEVRPRRTRARRRA
jgi:hypothetical protein